MELAKRFFRECCFTLDRFKCIKISCRRLSRNSKIHPNDANSKPHHIVVANDQATRMKYGSNRIRNTRYNIFTFIPKNFMEQMRHNVNRYLLFIATIQFWEEISTVHPSSIWLPLVTAILITAIKEGIDDFLRYLSDKKVNERKYTKISSIEGNLVEVQSQDIRAGDILYIKEGEEFPADLVLLYSSNDQDSGSCYVQTANIDGETDLKERHCVIQLYEFLQSKGIETREEVARFFSSFHGVVEGPVPNSRIADFDATLSFNITNEATSGLTSTSLSSARSTSSTSNASTIANSDNNDSFIGVPYAPSSPSQSSTLLASALQGTQSPCNNNKDHSPERIVCPLSSENLLLQATVLKNTKWIIGLVVYNGGCTKYGKSKSIPRDKVSKADKIIDRCALFIFIYQIVVIAVIGAVGFYINGGQSLRSHWYLGYGDRTWTERWYTPLIIPGRFMLIISFMLPVSLKVTLDIIKYLSALFIKWDLRLYDTARNEPCEVKNSNIGTDLGQVQYILSDKTGTITQNNMLLRKCCIGKCVYDIEEKPRFSLVTEEEIEFFRNLAICNSVACLQGGCCGCSSNNHNQSEGVCIEYSCSSSDEETLVKNASKLGITLTHRDKRSVDKRESYQILQVLEFTSERKRMSILVRNLETQRISLYSKGADQVMLLRLAPNADDDGTVSYLEKKLIDFGNEGLRTLCIAKKDVSQEEYAAWLRDHYDKAKVQLVDREKALARAFNVLEQNLVLQGITAIEDQLQDEAIETICKIRKAGIKFWMLTGDKKETAHQIALSSHMIAQGEKLFQIDGDNAEELWHSIETALADIKNSKDTTYSAIITGTSLGTIDQKFEKQKRQEFDNFILGATTVICCRVTPRQKSEIVSIVQQRGKKLVLSVGDGGNDVPMLQKANIGVGIIGREGRQAALAADYAIAKFKFLNPLLFVHGRWTMVRTSFIAQYTFYKSTILAFCSILFNAFAYLSGMALFNTVQMSPFNFVWTGISTFLFMLERDIEPDLLLNNPEIYKDTQRGRMLNAWSLFGWTVLTTFHTVICVFLPLLMVHYQWNNGNDQDTSWEIERLGTSIFTNIFFVITATIFQETRSFTMLNLLWFVLVTVGYIATTIVMSVLPMHTAFFYYFVALELITSPDFWLITALSISACCLPHLAYNFIELEFFPSEAQKAKEQHRQIFTTCNKQQQQQQQQQQQKQKQRQEEHELQPQQATTLATTNTKPTPMTPQSTQTEEVHVNDLD